MHFLTRNIARLLAMCAFYAAQWKERITIFIFRGDWRTAELICGIGLLSTGETKIDLVTDALWQTPLGITYKLSGICDMAVALLVIGAVFWSHGKEGNIRFRSKVNIAQFCLWLLTAYIYYLGFREEMFHVQAAMWADHFKAIVVMLIVVTLDFLNIAGWLGKSEEEADG